ncbi:isopentenyl-diphosphate delta-isomerase [Marinobacter sp. ATCH36]|uniref:isopentenyl-diphosphate delta-isomerase n=1 Tax=Marinobacter sp. ATCH36 TaxID=2945106 RepID=UPI002022684E|nr:isopentenyl-diphosphate delta-isomerase [Marinobacter sp. ATCH36]MCL7945504.1 isopentenyl-diphosphate delta-isomerase [Marinobacter sp. ATCH36]
MKRNRERIVSFDNEPLILVDEDDNVLGYESKLTCHQGRGRLHRAFSIFVFNRRNELLLQQRSSQKLLWPLFWSNSCCSHPRQGESDMQSAQRRLQEELSINVRLEFVYRFRYHASFGDIGAEHELCSVYIARSDGPVEVNDNEIASWCYMAPETLDLELAKNPEHYTPWLKMEWPRLRKEFWPRLEAL